LIVKVYRYVPVYNDDDLLLLFRIINVGNLLYYIHHCQSSKNTDDITKN